MKHHPKTSHHNVRLQCIRCGKCCLANMAALVYQIEDDDRLRWISEKRDDIIRILENESPVWAGDHLISSKTGNPIHSCHFLEWEAGILKCVIYETRPIVCRKFAPGSSELCPLFKK